jgi:cob(I)alamin adenosyltransferase
MDGLDRDGVIHLYYGPGKGKTTAAIGAALRASGRGLSVSILQFMKGHDEWGAPYGEIEALRERPGVGVRQFPAGHVRSGEELSPEERTTLEDGLEEAERAIADEDADLVVLDELTLLETFDVVETPRLVDLLGARHSSVEVVVTGRDAGAGLVDAASYATYMAEVKHPYRQGVEATPGIEY